MSRAVKGHLVVALLVACAASPPPRSEPRPRLATAAIEEPPADPDPVPPPPITRRSGSGQGAGPISVPALRQHAMPVGPQPACARPSGVDPSERVTVRVRLEVDAKGVIGRITAIDNSPRAFADAAQACARSIQFSP